MKRMIIGTILSVLFVGGTVAAQGAATQNPPARPAAPPASAPAAPQTPAPKPPPAPVPFPADAKIGFVNMQAVVGQSKIGKAGQEKIQALINKQNTDRAAKNAEIQKLQQEIQSGASVLSQTVLAQKNADVDRLTREAQFQEQQRQADLQTLNDQLLDEFQEKVLPLVELIRSEKGLWLILTAGDGSGIAAVHPGIDLSAELVKRLDALK